MCAYAQWTILVHLPAPASATSGCGTIEDLDCLVGERPCLDPGAGHGFEVDEAEVTFWGLCPTCQRERQADRSV